MRTDSIFAEIVLRLAPHPENLATEALLYILRKYPETWEPLRAWLCQGGAELPASLTFSSQVFNEADSSIPDLVGVDSAGDSVLIIEAKFWADLTPNQPSTYLRRLPPNKAAMVLVVAPEKRLDILWPKLRLNCEAADIQLSNESTASNDLHVAAAGSDHLLAVTSWRAVLALLRTDADIRHERDLHSDVEQLSGLCARMDSTEFLPLGPEDLSRLIGQRVQQFADLVDRVVTLLVRSHGANTKGLTTGGRQSTYGRFFRLHSLGCFLAYSPPMWSRYGETPLWLVVKDADWQSSKTLHDQVHRLFAGSPNRVCEHDGETYVGIRLLVGAESATVIADIVRQILMVAERCGLVADGSVDA